MLTASGRLYQRRYWDYEQALATALRTRAGLNPASARPHLEATQEEAIEAASQNWLTIISGGPGTGKTTTVLQILAKLLTAAGDRPVEIALAAPTGKAAARLQASLREWSDRTELSESVRARLPQGASTIHRLLGWKPRSIGFKHDAANPLTAEIVVVDEASMVSLPLMAKLFAALPASARVVLLGDRDQLASVEAGAVLADIADAAAAEKSALRQAFFVLEKNFRFGNENTIHRLASAVRKGGVEAALSLIEQLPTSEFSSVPVLSSADLTTRLTVLAPAAFGSFLAERDPAEALKKFDGFRLLTPVRQGPWGVETLNPVIESILHRAGLIGSPGLLYAGRPILITRNDPASKLYNGDVGILLPDPAKPDDQLWAWFPAPDGRTRKIAPARLPEHESAFAMTVHKAQGSEFTSVLVVMPDRDSPVLTRELVYTALTRASKRVELWYQPDTLRAALTRQASRISGLREALIENPKAPATMAARAETRRKKKTGA